MSYNIKQDAKRGCYLAMKRAILALMLVSLLALSGCITDSEPVATALPPMESAQIESREELYELYNQIDFNMTIAELEETLGPAARDEVSLENSTGTTLTWERNGVYTQAAISDGLIVGKAVSVEDPRAVAPLTGDVQFANVHKIINGMDYAQIVELMGCEGLEILARINRDESPVTINRLMRWTDPETGSVLQILFNQDGTVCTDDNSSSLYEFPTLEPGATYAPMPTADPDASPRPTAILTPAPTEASTEAPTEAPTEEPTEAPTEEPSAAPTEETAAATDAPATAQG